MSDEDDAPQHPGEWEMIEDTGSGIRQWRQLVPGGWLVLEHGFDQGGAVRTLLGERGFQDVTTRQDLEGRDRVTLGHV